MSEKKITLMIIDDFPEDLATYRRYLLKNNKQAYEIIEATSSGEALIQYESVKPDLILLDYLLPDFDGLEFIEQLKEQTNNLPPIIMLTGQGDEVIAAKAIKSGISDYLVKDKITAESLSYCLDNILKEHRLNFELEQKKRQQKLITDIALRISQSINLQDILAIVVTKVQQLLDCDRVVVCHFAADLTGEIIAESVKSPWRKALGTKIIDTCFQTQEIEKYQRGETMAIDDVDAAQLSQYHLELLTDFQVKANAIIPILYKDPSCPGNSSNSDLWGLLIAHHCSHSHQWQKDEIDLLNRLGIHLEIAIQQAELVNNLQYELNQSQKQKAVIQQAKETLSQVNIQLEQQIQKRTQELSEAKQAAEDANKRKDVFLAQMSHELRTPLNSILGFSTILEKAPNITPQQVHQINIIYQSGQHLLTLINQILDFSKISAKKLQLNPSNVNLKQFLAEIIDIFQSCARQKGLEFSGEISSSLPTTIKADPTRLRQVLYNLLSNAVKFTHAGRVTLKIAYVEDFEINKIRESNLTPESSPLKRIRFQVEDTGIGIPENKFAAIFTPFGQLDSYGINNEGTGLGLAISQQIIELMGSQIQLSSQVAQGSKFWFDLELLVVETNLAPALSEFSCKISRRLCVPRKILIVDDNNANRSLLVDYLQPFGFEVAEADNGQTGLEMAQTFQPDAILVDSLMPVMNGQEMVARLKQQPQLQDCLLIMISASSHSLVAPSVVGCHELLSKPINLEQLMQLLESYLQLDWLLPDSSTKFDNSSILATPSQETLIKLLELSELGDIERITQEIDFLEKLDAKYVPFIKQIRQLTASFQQENLVIFIKDLISIQE